MYEIIEIPISDKAKFRFPLTGGVKRSIMGTMNYAAPSRAHTNRYVKGWNLL